MPEPSEWIYRVEPSRPAMLTDGMTPEEEAAVGAHFAYLEALLERGALVLAGRTVDTGPRTFGIVVFRAATEVEARRIVEGDPAVRAGVMRAELFPYRIALLGR